MRFLARWRSPLFLFVLISLLVIPFATEPTLAQSLPSARKHPPPPPPPPAVDQEQFISYWTTETGWRTELQFRNNQVAQDLIVTPVLRTEDGTETSLSPVTIKPQEVKSIDLDTAIGASAPQVIGTYGSVVLRYHSVTASNLYAVAMIRGTGHSIAFHIDGMGESQEFQTGGREGIWWLPNNSVSDYLILTNEGASPLAVDLSLFDASGKAFAQQVTLAPRATTRFSVRQLVTAAGLAGSYGGIKVSAAAYAGSLDTLHVLFDDKAGFSAVMKMFEYDPKALIKERDHAKTGVWTLRAPMLALSNPDPALAFPYGTTLRPRIFIRNATAKVIDAALQFNWRAATTTGKAAGPQLRLLPYETRLIDVAALQDGTVLPKDANWTSVTLTTNSLPDEVMAVAASYDATLQYGAQTPFTDQLAHHWVGSMWEYDALHDSIITVGNGGTQPTLAAFTIFYNQGTQRYDLEQTLQPDEQMWIDIAKLIRENVPDKNGKALPAGVTSGSYEIWDLNNKASGTLFEGKLIYDKTHGHVTYGCGSCCGYRNTRLFFDPLAVIYAGSADNGVDGLDSCAGQWYDISDSMYGNWSTFNGAIATVDYYGTHTGQSVGSTSSSTFGGPFDIASIKVVCPVHDLGAGGSDKVTPRILLGGPGGTNITNTPQSVVVGQQIVLYGDYTLPSGVTVGSQSWSVPGTITGGFAHSNTNGGPTAYSTNGRTTTFYWYSTPNYAQATYVVTFTLNLSDGTSPQATATFKVTGTSIPDGIITPGSVQITSGNILDYIGPNGLPGMTFRVDLNLPPPGGITTWVQIRTDTWVRTSSTGTSRTCHAPPGLTTGMDGPKYPYDTGPQTLDSPYVSLLATDTETTRTFSATMYAMWDPQLANSIPVPLGYVPWNFSGDAIIVNATTNQWALKTSPTAGPNNVFQPSTNYASWSATLLAGEVCQ